jgi:flagellar basal-body rod protein FlgB
MSDALNVLERILRQANIRHSVLASNVANVDTPNFKAKDVSFGSILGNEILLASTNPRHLQVSAGSASGDVRIEETQPWADENNVEMDLQVAKMTENAMLYEAGVTLLKKKIQMFKSALRTSASG